VFFLRESLFLAPPSANSAPLKNQKSGNCFYSAIRTNTAPVHGYVVKGSWRYLEHTSIARAGDYVFESPGETHTLVVDEEVEEMITFFNISGCMYYVDEQGRNTGFEDVFTKIDMCRKHYAEVGLGADYVDQFVR
jgi:hypothetical protein